MQIIRCLNIVSFLLISVTLFAQGNKERKLVAQVEGVNRRENTLRVMFYNTENLFDPFNDSLTADEEFLPTGIHGWNYSRMMRKVINISKVVIAVGGWEPPDIVGLCEVENRFVLYKLLAETPLKNFDYKIVHHDSPDPRGIDVALLYRTDKFKRLEEHPIRVVFPFDTAATTRDILYVKGLVGQQDTIHIFINHWPSKYAGEDITAAKRDVVAGLLRSKTDSLLRVNSQANILIMGDLNDTPDAASIQHKLGASMDTLHSSESRLYNLLAGAGISWKKGTIKFQDAWQAIDQIVVSAAMLSATNGLQARYRDFHIFDAPFLLQDDEAWFGKKPFRTFNGSKYLGGFSDHLPVSLDIHY